MNVNDIDMIEILDDESLSHLHVFTVSHDHIFTSLYLHIFTALRLHNSSLIKMSRKKQVVNVVNYHYIDWQACVEVRGIITRWFFFQIIEQTLIMFWQSFSQRCLSKMLILQCHYSYYWWKAARRVQRGMTSTCQMSLNSLVVWKSSFEFTMFLCCRYYTATLNIRDNTVIWKHPERPLVYTMMPSGVGYLLRNRPQTSNLFICWFILA